MTEIRRATLEEIIALRHRVLRADTTIENAYFAEDHAGSTRHFAAFEKDRCVGCATFLLNEYDGGPAWQLRGMAVDPSLHRAGIGRRLLTTAEAELARESGVHTLWCHARKVAVPFYERCRWSVVGGEYQIIGIPHFTMTRDISST